jgi:rod shape-determining protein MreD
LAFLVWSAVLIISLILQSTLLEHPVLVTKPDLLLVIIVLWGLLRGSREGAQLGFFFGLVEDLFVGKYIGLNLLSKALAGYVAGWGESRFYKENLLLPAVGLLVATPFFQFVYYLFAGLGGLSIDPLIFVRDTLIKSGYHGLIAILIYYPLFSWANKVNLKIPEKNDPYRLWRR